MTDIITDLFKKPSPYETPVDQPALPDSQQVNDAEVAADLQSMGDYPTVQYLQDVMNTEWSTTQALFNDDNEIDLNFKLDDSHIKTIKEKLPQYLWDDIEVADMTSQKDFDQEIQRLLDQDAAVERLEHAGTMGQIGRVGLGMLDPTEVVIGIGAEAATLGSGTPLLVARYGMKAKRAATLLGGMSNAAAGLAINAVKDKGDNVTAANYGAGLALDWTVGAMLGRLGAEFLTAADKIKATPKLTPDQVAKQVDDLEKVIAAEPGSLSAAASPQQDAIRSGTTLNPELQQGDVPMGAKPLGTPRIDTVGQLATSKDPTTRALGPYFGEDAVGRTDGKATPFSTTEVAMQHHQSVEARWKQALVPSWKEWAKEQGFGSVRTKWHSQKDFDQFSRSIYDFVEDRRPGAEAFYPKSVVTAGKRFRELMKDYADDFRNPGRLDGTTLRSIADQPDDPHYVPKVADREEIDRLTATYGETAMRRLALEAVRDSMTQQGYQIDEKLMQKVADGWFTNISKAGYGTGDSLVEALAGRSKANLEEALGEIGIDKDTIAEITTAMGVKDGKSPRLKQRTPINYRYTAKLKNLKTGADEDVSILDMFSRDMDHLMMSYSRRAAGEVAMARVRVKDPSQPNSPDYWIDGITSRSEFETKVLKAVEDSHYRMGLSRSDAQQAIKKLEYLYRATLGLPQHNLDPKLTAAMRRVRTFNFFTKMNNMGITQLIETARPIAMTGLRAAFAQMPSLKRIVDKGAGTVELNNKMARELEMWGVTENDYWIGGTKYHYQEELIGEAGGAPTRLSKLGKQFDELANRGKEVMAYTSFQRPVHSRQQQWAARAAVQWFADNARNAKKFAKAEARIADMGLDKDDMAEIAKQVAAHAEAADPSMRKITAMNFEKWDPTVRSKFLHAVRRYTNRIVQVNDPGNLPMFMSHPVAQTFLQFRTFSFASYAKATQWNLKHRDQQALMIALGDIAFGAGTYAALVHARAVGRDDKEEFLAKERTLSNLALQGFARAGVSSLIPMGIDTALAATPMGPLFINARSSGQASDALGGSAPISLMNDAVSTLKGITESLWDGRDLSQQELRTGLKATPFGNHWGAMMLLNSMISGRDKVAPRREQ